MKKKIIFLVNLDSFFISHRLPLAKKLTQVGYEVHIATEFTKFKKYLKRLGFKTHNINFKRNSISVINFSIAFLQILNLFLKVKPDIVHLISAKAIILGGLNSFICRVRNLVISITGLGSIFINKNSVSLIIKFFIKFFYKIIFKFSNLKVIIQNRSDLNYLVKHTNLNKNKVKIIKGMGVDLRLFNYSKINNKIPVVLMASRIIADKGIFEFIQAAKYIKKLNIKAKFCLVGEIDYANPTFISKKKINNWKREKLIKFLNYNKNISNIIKKSSIVVLPSYREGFPKILIEAAACGRPVVTTNVPGCKDTIINGSTGILVPVKNSRKLAEAIIELCLNKKKLQSMSIKARKHAELYFDVNDVVNKHLSIYKSLLQ